MVVRERKKLERDDKNFIRDHSPTNMIGLVVFGSRELILPCTTLTHLFE